MRPDEGRAVESRKTRSRIPQRLKTIGEQHLSIDHALALLGPLFWGWFRARAREEHEWRYPTDHSVVSIDGIDPVRVLVIGDGPAAGCGVRTHQLGIAGHLAGHLAVLSHRGVVVTVAAAPAASARSTRAGLKDLDLDGYDSIVLMLAATDAFCFTPRRSWRRDMTALVQAITSTDATSVFVTSTASLQVARWLSRFARCLTGGHARMLDSDTARICAALYTPMIRLSAASDLTSRTYSRWGRRIGEYVAGSLPSQVADRVTSRPPAGELAGTVRRHRPDT
ncbi:MAG: hypothetical protein ABWY26_03770 [Microbacterium sp.]